MTDVESSTSELGKPVGSDAKNGKSTLLALRGADFCRDLVRARTEEALAILRKDFGAAENQSLEMNLSEISEVTAAAEKAGSFCRPD